MVVSHPLFHAVHLSISDSSYSPYISHASNPNKRMLQDTTLAHLPIAQKVITSSTT